MQQCPMKARRQRELEAAERAVTGQPDPDTATTLLDLLPCLQVSAELLREESFRELLEALHFDARFDPQRKALGIRVVLHPDLLTPPERPQTSPLLSVPPVGIGPGRSAVLSNGPFPRPAPPNRTCVLPRIRLSTSPCQSRYPTHASTPSSQGEGIRFARYR